MFAQGLELMLVGMGTVFVFLTILVFATSIMSRAVMRWAPDGSDETGINREHIAAISAALARHRGRS